MTCLIFINLINLYSKHSLTHLNVSVFLSVFIITWYDICHFPLDDTIGIINLSQRKYINFNCNLTKLYKTLNKRKLIHFSTQWHINYDLNDEHIIRRFCCVDSKGGKPGKCSSHIIFHQCLFRYFFNSQFFVSFVF